MQGSENFTAAQFVEKCRTRGVTRGAQCPGAESLGALKSPNNAASFFFNAGHLLPKDLSFKYGGANLASCPGRNITSVCPFVTPWTLHKFPSLAIAPELIFFRSLPRFHDHR